LYFYRICFFVVVVVVIDLFEIEFQLMCLKNSLKVNDYCAVYLDSDSFWHRSRIVAKSTSKQTFLLDIIDFGDVHEVPINKTKILEEE
jgi:hypothetical protein